MLRIFVKYYFVFFIATFISVPVYSQDFDRIFRDFDRGELNQVRSALESFEARYSSSPEYLFLRAVFEEDAEQAFVIYQQIKENAPDKPVFERALWRMCQYNFAKGLYRSCNDMVYRFISTFPKSDFLGQAQKMQRRVSEKLGENIPEPPANPEKPKKVYTIQFDAFGIKRNAERRMKYYQDLGITGVYIKEDRVGRQLYYKIRVGEFIERNKAVQEAEELQRKYRLTSHRIVEIVR